MGWYHYQCAEDGTCDVNKTIPCPDGTCQPDAAPPEAAEEEEEEIYYAQTPIYHLCQKKLWLQAIQANEPYFPPTFWKDGRFTRASCEAATLPQTANHYYQDIAGDWLCLEMLPRKLREMGMPIVAQRAPESTKTDPIECLKVYGGIPVAAHVGVVKEVYAMQRDDQGRFFGMKPDASVPKHAGAKVDAEEPSLTEKLAREMVLEERQKKLAALNKKSTTSTSATKKKVEEAKTPVAVEQPASKPRRKFWQRG